MANQKYTVTDVIEALTKREGRVAIAAEDLGCSAQTIYNYGKRYPSIAAFIEHKNEKRLDMAENALWELVMAGNLGAVIFYLKTQGKRRGYTERTELTGDDGGPVKLVVEYVNKRDDNTPSAT